MVVPRVGPAPALSVPPDVPRRWWEGRADVLLYAAFAAFAAGTAVVTHLPPHRVWGWCAAVAYGLGAVAAASGRPRCGPVAWGVTAGAALLPLAVLAVGGLAQPEVGVVHRAGALLLERGTPYLDTGELAAWRGYEGYNPYLPGMALFGVPWALAGIDARPLFGAVLAAALLWGARRTPPLLLASPLVALPLAVGGDDLPVIGLVCLGLALAARDRPGAAGLALGVAATLKATALPALVVCLALVVVRHRAGAGRFLGGAGGVVAVGVLPVVAVDPRGFVENVVRFPLGLAGVASPAASPLPGRLLADLGAYGHAAGFAALGAAAAAMALSLLVRPPGDLRAAAGRLALGLALATALMPATRWGYLVYPAVLVVWARAAGRDRPRAVADAGRPREEVAACAA
ncbi:glycosyltransferase 87 family protein [Actinomadura kijaniata]|uniref:glycosyltransferase 87 family protein n=1 Tax=Actinomadura kijaniata TaxID=46161 RepID=UPI002FED76E9